MCFLHIPNPRDTRGERGHSQGQPLSVATKEQIRVKFLTQGHIENRHLVGSGFKLATFQLLAQRSNLQATCCPNK
jgi:hypothetical protein